MGKVVFLCQLKLASSRIALPKQAGDHDGLQCGVRKYLTAFCTFFLKLNTPAFRTELSDIRILFVLSHPWLFFKGYFFIMSHKFDIGHDTQVTIHPRYSCLEKRIRDDISTNGGNRASKTQAKSASHFFRLKMFTPHQGPGSLRDFSNFEKTRIHFSSDVFTTVTVVVYWAPSTRIRFCLKTEIFSSGLAYQNCILLKSLSSVKIFENACFSFTSGWIR